MTNEEFIKSVSLEGEEWRDVVGYEGLYMVSSLGRILSFESSHDIVMKGMTFTRTIPSHIMKPYVLNTGYLQIMLRKNKPHKFSIHRLVAIAFIENPDSLPHVDHINGNREDNRVSNLRWCNAVSNMSNPITQFRVESGRAKVSFPYRQPVVQIKDGLVVNTYKSIYDTRLSGYNPSSVNRCVNGYRKEYLGYRWIRLSDYEASINKSKNT